MNTKRWWVKYFCIGKDDDKWWVGSEQVVVRNIVVVVVFLCSLLRAPSFASASKQMRVWSGLMTSSGRQPSRAPDRQFYGCVGHEFTTVASPVTREGPRRSVGLTLATVTPFVYSAPHPPTPFSELTRPLHTAHLPQCPTFSLAKTSKHAHLKVKLPFIL